ncbi:hypothetical protein P6F26_07630 [Roseibacterium sp. SDUM158017]|uniref:hypothetical protein n=1 Tax=Roseicyclus salinarum TaxID=3036773 RepID=UPI00241552F6|nr:hypothetical protein [Roseibacterium sp. SDUM158017]MDG4648312.1 hypothetical protein [Roseibacterium sp. SDUM158017]
MRLVLPLLTAVFLGLAALPVAAQDDEAARLEFGGDAFAAGDDLELDGEIARDLFAASEDIALVGEVGGAAHLAARRLDIGAPTGRLYGFAYEIDLSADVAGPALLAAAEAEVDAAIGGNLRLFARDADVSGSVGGSAMIAAEDLRLDAAVAGDLMLAVETVDFGPGATVAGQVILYVEDGDTAPGIPERVAPADRVEVRDIDVDDAMPGGFDDMRRTAWRAAVTGFFVSVLTVAALAAAAVAVAPAHVAQWRERALSHPGQSFGAGFVLVSLISGAGFVLALTIIGIPLFFAALFMAGLVGFAGYVMGSYILGVGIWLRLGNEMPHTVLPRAGLALLGAFVAGIVTLIPFLGWLAVLALSLTGAGAVAIVIRETRQARQA